MKLTLTDLQQNIDWEKKGYALPSFDRNKVQTETLSHPFWIHFGAGNIFREIGRAHV